jgi:hypothetical protein
MGKNQIRDKLPGSATLIFRPAKSLLGRLNMYGTGTYGTKIFFRNLVKTFGTGTVYFALRCRIATDGINVTVPLLRKTW